MPKASCEACEYVYLWVGKPDASVAYCPICSIALTPNKAPGAWPKIRVFEIGLWLSNAGKFSRYLTQDDELTLGYRCDFCGKPAEDRPVHVAFPRSICRCQERENEGVGDGE